MKNIVHLSHDDLHDLLSLLNYHAKRGQLDNARINTEQGGLKISINYGVWTPEMGEVKPAS